MADGLSSYVIWLFRYLPTYALVKPTSFGSSLFALVDSREAPWRQYFLCTRKADGLSMRWNCTDILLSSAYVVLVPDRGSFMTKRIGFVSLQHHFLIPYKEIY